MIINDKYIKRIETQIKKIVKYTNKNNTSSFGILVLQLMKSFYNFQVNIKKLFELGTNFKIVITSPSNFMQYVLMINTLDGLASILKNFEKYKEEITKVVTHIKNFYKVTNDFVKKINIAFAKHLKNIAQNIKQIEKTKKKNSYLIENKED